MLTQNGRSGHLATLAHQVCDAESPSPALLRTIAETTCKRAEASRQSARLTQLIDDGASTDAALAMIELELPSCRLRRIVYDDGKWHCALSRQRELPDWLDDAVETSHASLPLAVLGAYLEALQHFENAKVTRRPSVPSTPSAFCERLCCENFS